MSSSCSADPVASRTRAGLKRKRDEGPGQVQLIFRGTRFIPALDRINRRVEAFQANVDRREPAEIINRIEVQVTRIRLRQAEERVRQMERNLEDIRHQLEDMLERLQGVEEGDAGPGHHVDP